jgi:hypothetical protein
MWSPSLLKVFILKFVFSYILCIIKGFLNGDNGVAMAMGITGCGKTYTLIVSVKINRI